MIPNPVEYLRHYLRDHFPELFRENIQFVGIGKSAHVDIWLPALHPVPRIRLMLPHTAPIDAVPLLAEINVGTTSLWKHTDDPNFYRGNRVHLYRSGNLYLMLYVKPDIERDWLTHVTVVNDLLLEKPLLTQRGELFARVTIARKLGYQVELNREQRQRVLAMQKRYRQK